MTRTTTTAPIRRNISGRWLHSGALGCQQGETCRYGDTGAVNPVLWGGRVRRGVDDQGNDEAEDGEGERDDGNNSEHGDLLGRSTVHGIRPVDVGSCVSAIELGLRADRIHDRPASRSVGHRYSPG